MKENCSKVVLLQIRDKKEGAWEDNSTNNKDIWDLITKPALLTQNNLFRFLLLVSLFHFFERQFFHYKQLVDLFSL